MLLIRFVDRKYQRRYTVAVARNPTVTTRMVVVLVVPSEWRLRRADGECVGLLIGGGLSRLILVEEFEGGLPIVLQRRLSPQRQPNHRQQHHAYEQETPHLLL